MQIIEDATRFTAVGSEPSHWIEHYRSQHMSVGTYSIPRGGRDDQEPHHEEEIYVVISGRATLVTAGAETQVGPGCVIQVAAGEQHRFTDVGEDLTLLVVFAPPETT